MRPSSSNSAVPPVTRSCQKLLRVRTVVLAGFAADHALFCCTTKCLQYIPALSLHFPLSVTEAQPTSACAPLAVKMWDSHPTASAPLSCSSDVLFRRQRLWCCILFSTKENHQTDFSKALGNERVRKQKSICFLHWDFLSPAQKAR